MNSIVVLVKKKCGSFLYANFIVAGDRGIIDHSMIDHLQCRDVLLLVDGRLDVEGPDGVVEAKCSDGDCW